MSKIRTIGKLAAEVGVSVETIRYYEREGLIEQPRRTDGPRHYDDKALATLRYIRIGQQMGLSLKDVKQLQTQLGVGDTFCRSLQAVVQARLESLAKEADEIGRLQQELTSFLTRCRARDPDRACPIVEELTRLDSAVSSRAARTGAAWG